MDLRKEYNRYCKLYSSEPLDIIAGPLEKASYRMDSVELDLKGRGLRGVDCMALGKLLTSNTSISHLNMSDCLLLPQGFGSLLEGLGRNVSLQVLDLRGNNIQTKMVENLSSFLRQNTTLKTLLLEWNCLGASQPAFETFCESLGANKGLERLDLRNNLIADECGVFIASALKSNVTLRSLDLRWNSLGIQGAKALWDAVQCNEKLGKVELTGNFVPEEIVRHIQSTLSTRSRSRSRSMAQGDTKEMEEGDLDDFRDDLSPASDIEDKTAQQLQKTEDNCRSEVKNLLTVFDDEEMILQEALRSAQTQISTLRLELNIEKKSKQRLVEKMDKLREDLATSKEIEKTLRDSLQAKNEFILQRDAAVKMQAAEIESRFEGKIAKVTKDLESIQGENDKLSQDLKEALGCLRRIRDIADTDILTSEEINRATCSNTGLSCE